MDPQKILAISFKRDSADNLKKRVIRRCGNEIATRFISMTYDAFSKSLLDHFRLALPKDIRPNGAYTVNDSDTIDAAFKKAGFKNFHNLSHSRLEKYYNDVLKSVQLPFSKNDLGENVWKLLLKGFDDHEASLSFSMICILAEFIIRKNPKIKRGLQFTYKHIFLDEFQDTTNLQYKLVKQCFENSNSIMTAVGDNKQRIMLWAGARKTVFEDFERDFYSETQRLIMNHRSAPRLVDLQRKMYASLNESEDTVRVSDKWNPEDGTISLLIAQNEYDEASRVAEHIFKQVSSGIEPNKLCILCKQQPSNYTQKIIDDLDAYHIRARIENDYQDLIKEPIVEMIIKLLQLAIDRRRPNDWEFIVSKTEALRNINSLQSNDDYFGMQDRLCSELDYLRDRMKQIVIEEDVYLLIDSIIKFWGSTRIMALHPEYKQGTYFIDLLNKFKNYIWKELQASKMDWSLAIENFQGLHSVPIMTIHKSKGLEYDVVYFVGLEDSAFWNFKNQPEEDRCAFFVALSRAKKEIFFTFCEYRNTKRFPRQTHDQINEFFELLQEPGIATIIN